MHLRSPNERDPSANVAGCMAKTKWKSGSRLVIDPIYAWRQLSNRLRVLS